MGMGSRHRCRCVHWIRLNLRLRTIFVFKVTAVDADGAVSAFFWPVGDKLGLGHVAAAMTTFFSMINHMIFQVGVKQVL